MSDRRPAVMFVGGYGRSGSTVLDVRLAGVPGVVPVGEFRHLFGRALGDNELCSCSEPFQDCGFWREVVATAFPEGLDREAVHGSMVAVNRLAALPGMWRWPIAAQRLRPHLERYAASFAAAYRAVAAVTGAKVIVDSSKYPLHGMALAAANIVDLRVLSLVRDPRAVAHSWQRKRIRPEVHWEERYMPQHSVARSALAWSLSNFLTRRIGSSGTPLRTERYEDFAADPDAQLAAIASFALGQASAASEPTASEVHTIAGNPVRLAAEPLVITPDLRWTREMAASKQLIVAALSAAGMTRYGYPLRPQRN